MARLISSSLPLIGNSSGNVDWFVSSVFKEVQNRRVAIVIGMWFVMCEPNVWVDFDG